MSRCLSYRGLQDCGHTPTADEPICFACANACAREKIKQERAVDLDIWRLRNQSGGGA